MKKILCIMLAAIVAATVAGCSGGSPSETGQSPQTVQGDVSDQEEDTDPGESTDNTADTAANQGSVTVDEQVLMEQDGITVTLKSLETGGFMGPELKVLVENDGDDAVAVQVKDVSVNGIMVSTMFSCNVEPGKKANDGISFMESELNTAGIAVIKDVELKFHIFDPNSFNTLFDTETVSFSTSADYVQQYDDSGSVALDRDGIKVVVKKLDSESSFWGADIYVYVENNSDTDSTIQIRDTSVNGFMIDPMFSCEVLAGKKAFSSITFLENQLTDNDITDITELEFSFHVVDKDSYNTIFDSDTVTINF